MLRPLLLLLLISLLPPVLSSPLLPSRQSVAELDTATKTACVRPAPWNQILTFFLTNYIARILTYKKTSGYRGTRDYFYVIASLFVPFIGISGAAATIARGSRFLAHDDVDRALLAEALCVIVREEGWRPADGEIIQGCVVVEGDERGRRKLERRARRRHKREKKKRRRGEKRRSRHQEEEEDSDGPQFLGDSRSHMHQRLNTDADSDRSAMLTAEEDEDDDAFAVETFSSSSATLIIGPAGITKIDPEKYKIQGHFTLPPDYTLAKLPPGTELMPLAVSRAVKTDIVISNSYNATKAFTGIVQIISSLYALYSAYGSQVTRYGYAAFGFTVLPYTVMSILNTIANLIEASYDCIFLVRSDVMLEAEQREGGEFVGEVAELVPATKAMEKDIELTAAGVEFVDLRFLRGSRGGWKAVEVDDDGRVVPGSKTWSVFIPPLDGSYDAQDDPRAKILVQPVGQSYVFSRASHKRSKRFRQWAVAVIMVFSLVVPYAVIGGISKFRPGRSEKAQKLFMAGWLVVGQIIGALNLVGQTTKARRKLAWWSWLETIVMGFVVVGGFAFAVGGFIEVGRMLREFGYCIRLSG